MTKLTSDRAQQRERLEDLDEQYLNLDSRQDSRSFVDFLLDNGVSVEVPPEPEVKPGTAGWGTVKILGLTAKSVRGLVYLNDDGDPWFTYVDSDGYGDEADFDYVTDFVPDVLLPPELGEQIVDWIADHIDSSPEGLLEFRAYWAERFGR